MRKLLLNIVLGLVLTSSIIASPVDEMMNDANKFYQDENFESALEKYTQVADQGFVSPALYYNLGNTYFKLGQIGKAVLNYERGLKIDPDDEDLKYNLKIVQSRMVDRIKYVPQIIIVEWWNSLLTFLSVSGWAAVVIFFYLSLLVFVGLYFLTKSGRMQRLSFLFGSANLIVLLMVVFLFVARVNRETSKEFGILITDVVTVKNSPGEKGDDLFVIHEGIKFSIEDELEGWAEIQLSDGKVGWLNKSAFERI